MKYFGNVFKNTPKEGGSDNQPIYRGNASINGVKYKIAGWIKYDKNNKPYQSFEFTVADDQGSTEKWKTKQNVTGMKPVLDDDVPF